MAGTAAAAAGSTVTSTECARHVRPTTLSPRLRGASAGRHVPRRLGMDTMASHGPDRTAAAPRGMTLIELLVVVAVLAVLMALLLPAVQGARAVARRMHCANNLRHVGCALHGHLIAKRTFPVGCQEWRPPGSARPADLLKRNYAWSARILPWLEAQATSDAIDFGRPYDDPVNRFAAATVIPVYLCPSAGRSAARVGGLGATDYGGINGERITSPNTPVKGVFVNDRGFAERDIPDGLSKTIFVGECAREEWAEGQWISGYNLFDQRYEVNGPTWEDEIRSSHAGGANVLAGDGSVHLLAETTDLRILAAACTRELGERVPTPWSLP